MLAFFACVCYNAHTKMCDKVAILQIFVTTEYLFRCTVPCGIVFLFSEDAWSTLCEIGFAPSSTNFVQTQCAGRTQIAL